MENKMRPQPECPECEKLMNVSGESNKIGQFLDYFLPSEHLVLARWVDNEDSEIPLDEMLVPAYEYQNTNGINKLLAKYFKIDLDKVEDERRELLKWLQEKYEEDKQDDYEPFTFCQHGERPENCDICSE